MEALRRRYGGVWGSRRKSATGRVCTYVTNESEDLFLGSSREIRVVLPTGHYKLSACGMVKGPPKTLGLFQIQLQYS